MSDVSSLTGSGVGVTRNIFRVVREEEKKRKKKSTDEIILFAVQQRGVKRGKMIYSDSISIFQKGTA